MTATIGARLVAERDRFLEALRDVRGTQAQLLEEIVGRNRETVFGREHGFAEIRSHADYTRRVPIRDHDGHLPWLKRGLAGEMGVLTAAPAKMYLSTTGSTAEPKVFPATQAYLTDTARDEAAYWGMLVAHEPALLERDDAVVPLHLIPRAISERTERGVPIHRLAFMSHAVKGALPFTRAPWYPPPSELDLRRITYYLLRLSCEHPVVGFVCQHSSRLTGMLYAMRREGPRLVEEVRAGTLFGVPTRPPNPARADALQALLDEDAFVPRHVWPSLRMATAWRGGTYDLVRQEIDAGFGATIFPAPCVSTEAGHINLPLDSEADGPPTIRTNYYEFRIPGAADDAPTMTVADLEEGPVYEMIVTTKSGLYRYCCNDLFRVVGRIHGAPRLEFVSRVGTVNLTGEKLSDEQAQRALAAAVERVGGAVMGATICATWGEPPFYTAVIEPTAPWSAERCADIAAYMDQLLSTHNSRYAWKRDWDELAPLAVRTVSPGTFDRVQHAMMPKDSSLPSLKHKPLHGELTALSLFDSLDRDAT